MAESYLPTREAELLAWANNFATLIKSTPSAYGLTEPQAAAFETLNVAFANAYAVSKGPDRGPEATETKKQAKFAMIADARKLVRIIQSYPGTTNELRIGLQITVPDVEPTPVPVPPTAPLVQIVSVLGRTVRIKLKSATEDRRGLPVGVDGATVMGFVGETAPDDPMEWSLMTNTARTTVDVDFPLTVPAGSKVWLSAFWFNERKQSGPTAAAQHTYIAGGMAAAA